MSSLAGFLHQAHLWRCCQHDGAESRDPGHGISKTFKVFDRRPGFWAASAVFSIAITIT